MTGDKPSWPKGASQVLKICGGVLYVIDKVGGEGRRAKWFACLKGAQNGGGALLNSLRVVGHTSAREEEWL